MNLSRRIDRLEKTVHYDKIVSVHLLGLGEAKSTSEAVKEYCKINGIDEQEVPENRFIVLVPFGKGK